VAAATTDIEDVPDEPDVTGLLREFVGVEMTVSPNLVDEPLRDILGVVGLDAALLLGITGNQPEFLSVTYNARDWQKELLTFDVVATMADASVFKKTPVE